MTAPAAAERELQLEVPLAAGWEMASAPEASEPTAFLPASVPGTVAAALRAQGAWRMGEGARFDESHYWYRCLFDAQPAARNEELALRFGGLATLAEVSLNGETILESESMFAAHEVNVSRLIREHNELRIAFRPLSRALDGLRRRSPAPRWRSRLVSHPQLRWIRTTLLGRAPGFSPEPQAVGPWRAVSLLRRRKAAVESWTRRLSLDGSSGIAVVQIRIRTIAGARIEKARIVTAESDAELGLLDVGDDMVEARGVLRIRDVARWWPHTHGEPALYPIWVELQFSDGSTARFQDAPAGFRTLDSGSRPEIDADLSLRLNETPVFCRGAVWTPPDIVTLNASSETVESRLLLLRDGGFNMVRLPGTAIYETEDFHRCCDRLGLLVWQDMMFANMDYPFSHAGFHNMVRAEATTELGRLARHPSTAVVCGNSEVEQQASMLGLPPDAGRGVFFGEELPRLVAEICPGVPYVPSAPCGGDLPIRPNHGVANYFGAGAYLRDLSDVRRAGVKFASECLAFANVPEPEMFQVMAGTHGKPTPTQPAWKHGVPRDSGAGWDFEDVRDHYLKLLYGLDPVQLRYSDTETYWDISRVVTGEVMSEVFGEWRRPGSECGGGIVLWSTDLEPGAGWGILDSSGAPKAAYWFLKRALAGRTVWMTDEGLNGVDAHVANDSPESMNAVLRIALYRHGEHKVAEAAAEIEVPARQARTFGVEQILGRFVDASYAYRFGPPGHDLIAASLHASRGDFPMAQAFRFPAGHPIQKVPIADLGLTAEWQEAEGKAQLLLQSKRFAWGVRIGAQDYRTDDQYFGLEPGVPRRVILTPLRGHGSRPKAAISAVNAEGRLHI
jgi:beta-mannosidase